jgi:hypothetical protein
MRWILIAFFACFFSSSFAQDASEKDSLIRLNRHYFEIAADDSVNHVYDKLVSYSEDGVKLERIFTRDGKVDRVVMTRARAREEEFYEQVTDQYNAYNELEWRKTENLLNQKYRTLYLFNNEVVGRVLAESDMLYYVARNGETEPRQQNFNDFEPQFSVPINDFYKFASKKFRLSAKLHPKEKPEWYLIAVLINEDGMVDQVEWANPLGGNPMVAEQYIRVIELWGNNFHPALDPFGHPVTKWWLIPFTLF